MASYSARQLCRLNCTQNHLSSDINFSPSRRRQRRVFAVHTSIHRVRRSLLFRRWGADSRRTDPEADPSLPACHRSHRSAFLSVLERAICMKYTLPRVGVSAIRASVLERRRCLGPRCGNARQQDFGESRTSCTGGLHLLQMREHYPPDISSLGSTTMHNAP